MKNNQALTWIIIAVAVLLFLGFTMGWGGYGGYGGMMGYNNMMNWGGMWVFGWLFMTLVVIALVLFIAWLVKQIQK
ncbi:hypothetical protein J4422_00120 [Candidatus Pacearchaeota archaeon]|nr:hypothetical protein [Candidatus Pacearchaeota archaeon]